MNLQKRLDSNVQSFQRVQAIASVGNMLKAKLSVGMALTLTFTINTLPINAAQSQQTENFCTFAEWCKNQASLSEDARQTVALLLEKAETTECDRASLALSNLTELDLNPISDIRPLSRLTNLTELNLYVNQISDIKPLSGLTNLTELTLNNNTITDIRPLSALTNLAKLNLSDNQIADISPLSGLTNLAELNLGSNQIIDVRPLSRLTRLTSLSLSKNQITDIQALSGLTNLTGLYLWENPIANRTCPSNLEMVCTF